MRGFVRRATVSPGGTVTRDGYLPLPPTSSRALGNGQ